MGTVRKKFDDTFKLEAVRLAETSGKRDRTIERELNQCSHFLPR
jgi:hypothetical protein